VVFRQTTKTESPSSRLPMAAAGTGVPRLDDSPSGG
jgi:hypothetical protein